MTKLKTELVTLSNRSYDKARSISREQVAKAFDRGRRDIERMHNARRGKP